MDDRYAITLELAYRPETDDQLSMADLCEEVMLHLLDELEAKSPGITACEGSRRVWASVLVEEKSPGAAMDQAEALIRSAFHALGAKTPGWELRSGTFDSAWDRPNAQAAPGGQPAPA